jgi:hypothetical protein
MAACLFEIAGLYARFGYMKSGEVEMRSRTGQWAVAVIIYTFTANFSWSWAMVSFLSVARGLYFDWFRF